ncbi:unnamed protein product [Spodoptera exigua]|nr:unnamed protein product [Spodoptera exigua]
MLNFLSMQIQAILTELMTKFGFMFIQYKYKKDGSHIKLITCSFWIKNEFITRPSHCFNKLQ